MLNRSKIPDRLAPMGMQHVLFCNQVNAAPWKP